jgi:hypothetical protein
VTGIPRSTVRDWAYGRTPNRSHQAGADCTGHDVQSLDPRAYAYLLGLYLGDGYIARNRRVWRLRITLDSQYPGIVAECIAAIEAVRPGKCAHAYRRRDERATEVSNYWNHWPCLFPQHGPGRKHLRPILLEDWQQAIVRPRVEWFLRGLIHSDGTRIVATERKGTYVRHAPRYVFSNRSEHILGLFQDACRVAGVYCTRSSERQISVYRKFAVARMDEFIGPKS